MNTDTKEERMKRFSERMPALREKFQRMRERLYIERRLAENGIDIEELEQAG